MLFLGFARAIVTREPSVSAGRGGGKPQKCQGSYAAEVAPDEVAEITKLDEAENYLTMAYRDVTKSAESMRDLPAEERGEAGTKAAKEAERARG